MNAAQKPICKVLGNEKSYQSVLNCQKGVSFLPVQGEHIQLMHDRNSHWIMTSCSNGRAQVCDSLQSRLSCITKRSIKKFYQTSVVSLLPVQKERNGWNCGLFSVAFAAEILGGTSPMEANLYADRMRAHWFFRGFYIFPDICTSHN